MNLLMLLFMLWQAPAHPTDLTASEQNSLLRIENNAFQELIRRVDAERRIAEAERLLSEAKADKEKAAAKLESWNAQLREQQRLIMADHQADPQTWDLSTDFQWVPKQKGVQ
jgi:hypothetical protein